MEISLSVFCSLSVPAERAPKALSAGTSPPALPEKIFWALKKKREKEQKEK
jgi:hypothetical protein